MRCTLTAPCAHVHVCKLILWDARAKPRGYACACTPARTPPRQAVHARTSTRVHVQVCTHWWTRGLGGPTTCSPCACLAGDAHTNAHTRACTHKRTHMCTHASLHTASPHPLTLSPLLMPPTPHTAAAQQPGTPGCAHTCVQTHTLASTRAHLPAFTHRHASTQCMCMHASAHAPPQVHAHTCAHLPPRSCTHTHVQADTTVHLAPHSSTHACTHTHMHVCPCTPPSIHAPLCSHTPPVPPPASGVARGGVKVPPTPPVPSPGSALSGSP